MSDLSHPLHDSDLVTSPIHLSSVLPSTAGSPASTVTILGSDESDTVTIPPAAHTLDGFRSWARSPDFPTHGRLTFADGELIVDMSPEYLESHNYVKSEISFVLYGMIQQEKLGRFFSDRVLYSNETAGISTEPDAMFASHDALASGRCKLIEGSQGRGFHKEVVGTPDWVLEVLSRGSVRKDQKFLWERYGLAGIPEYWLVDATGEELFFKIYVRAEKGYRLVDAPDGWAASPTFGRVFRLTRYWDEHNSVQYKLEVQKRT